MININEKRFSRRILAVCRALDLKGNFVGLTLDLTKDGIHLIVANTFVDQDKFYLILQQTREDEEDKPNLTMEVEKMWRKPTNEEYDQIGGKILRVDLEEELHDLIQYCDHQAKQKYEIDPV